jgi:hypothetical protein
MRSDCCREGMASVNGCSALMYAGELWPGWPISGCNSVVVNAVQSSGVWVVKPLYGTVAPHAGHLQSVLAKDCQDRRQPAGGVNASATRPCGVVAKGLGVGSDTCGVRPTDRGPKPSGCGGTDARLCGIAYRKTFGIEATRTKSELRHYGYFA